MWCFSFQRLSAGVIFLCAALPLIGATPEISRLQAVSTNGTIQVRLELKNSFELDEIAQSLQSGLPTGFTFHLELVRKRPNWFDDTLATSRIEVIATYNSVTREYLVNYRRNGKLVRSETVSELTQLRDRMTRLDEPALFTRQGRPAHKLVVRARADITRKIIFYIVPSVVSTDWKQTRVRTAPPDRTLR